MFTNLPQLPPHHNSSREKSVPVPTCSAVISYSNRGIFSPFYPVQYYLDQVAANNGNKLINYNVTACSHKPHHAQHSRKEHNDNDRQFVPLPSTTITASQLNRSNTCLIAHLQWRAILQQPWNFLCGHGKGISPNSGCYTQRAQK